MAITTNKRAYYDYEILDTLEAGIVLSGPEVKSVKAGRIDLRGAYVTLDFEKQARLINCYIAPYPPARGIQQTYDPSKSRQLLLLQKEIKSLLGKLKSRGLTLIPLEVYTKGGIIKFKIGLAKGKKKYDKRELIKKREVERKIQGALI